MIKEIFLKELMLMIRSKRFLLSFVIIVVLFMLNSFLYCFYYNKEKSFNEDFKQNRIWMLEKREINPWYLIFASPEDNVNFKDSIQFIETIFGYQKLVKPLSGMSFISQGGYGLIPNGIDINYFSISHPKVYASEEGFVYNNQVIDWNFIFIVLVSFVVILVSYDSISGEKFKGTLKIILANRITRSKLFIGKYLGIFFTIMIPLIIGIILCSIVIYISIGEIEFDNLLIYIISIFLYISFLILMSILISTLTVKPIKSLTIILMMWTIFTIIIPNIGWIFAKELLEIPSLEKINHADKPLENVRWEYEWESKPPTREVYEYFKKINNNTKYHNQLWKDYNNQLFEQTELAYTISKLSPFMVFQHVSEKISDNGLWGYLNFYNQIHLYQESYTNYLKKIDQVDKNSYHLIWNNIHTAKHFMSSQNWSVNKIPQFEYQAPNVKQILKAIEFDVIILIIWNVVLCILVFSFFIRYDVR